MTIFGYDFKSQTRQLFLGQTKLGNFVNFLLLTGTRLENTYSFGYLTLLTKLVFLPCIYS